VFEERLEALRREGLLRSISDRDSPQGRIIRVRGGVLVNFSSNDYLGLCGHDSLRRAAARAAEEYGAGSGASRLLSGGTALHRRLERLLSDLKATEDSVLFGSGYAANTGAIPAIADRDATIFSDELNHASLIDGCRLSRASTVIYRHADMDHLEELLRTVRRGRPVIVTDSVFSMDGDIAPLRDLTQLAAAHDALLYIDDAHGTGVLGRGRGALSHFGIPPESFVIQMGTLSKAAGSYGAFIAAGGDLVRWLVNTARTLIYSTALPAHLVAASVEAVRIMTSDALLVDRLWRNRESLVRGLHCIGVDTGRSETPIVPILLEDDQAALRLSEFLRARGIHAPAIRRPTVRTPRLRLTVSAAHTEEDIALLITSLREARDCGLF